MHHERLITGVAATLGAIAVVLTVVGLTGSPLALPVAASFAVAAALMYDQLSGRMAARVYERVERHARVDAAGADVGPRDGRSRRQAQTRRRRTARQRSDRERSSRRANARQQATDGRGDAGAGPRGDWRPPRDGATAREAAGRRRAGNGRAANDRATTGPGSRESAVSAASAYRTLGLDPGADQEAIKAAYREKVKEVHPDTPEGDEAAFMAVKDAYERLAD